MAQGDLSGKYLSNIAANARPAGAQAQSEFEIF